MLNEGRGGISNSATPRISWMGDSMRRGVDAVMRACPVVVLPGYSRPLIRVADYLALIESNTYRGDRVRP